MQNQYLPKDFQRAKLFLLLITFAVCSQLNAFSSGRTDRLKGAPFFKVYNKKAAVANTAVGHLSVGIDVTTKSEFFYAGREQALQPLIDAVDAYLDSLSSGTRLSGDSLPLTGEPYVYIGSAEGEGAPPEAAMQRNEHDKYPPMILHVQNPSSGWRTAMRALAKNAPVEYVALLKLGFSEYPKSDKGMFGKKVVLGTGYEEGIKFLSAEDAPVEVLQITGILLDREGSIVRAGAEGIVAKDTPFWVEVFEAQQGMNNAALQNLVRNERREDLPGRPLKWQAALRHLMKVLLQ